jgi:hypothetical protein
VTGPSDDELDDALLRSKTPESQEAEANQKDALDKLQERVKDNDKNRK